MLRAGPRSDREALDKFQLVKSSRLRKSCLIPLSMTVEVVRDYLLILMHRSDCPQLLAPGVRCIRPEVVKHRRVPQIVPPHHQ